MALAAIVENAGWGSAAAAPIARRVLDYLLADQYPSEEDIALVREGKSSGPPVGTPRRVEDVPLPSQTPVDLPLGLVPMPAAAASGASVAAPASAAVSGTAPRAAASHAAAGSAPVRAAAPGASR